MRRIFILFVAILLMRSCKNYFLMSRTLHSDTYHEWNFKDSKEINYFDFVYGETLNVLREIRYRMGEFDFIQKSLNIQDTINLYIENETLYEWENFQRRNLLVSQYKSQVYEKQNFPAYYISKDGDTSKVKIKNVGMNLDHYQNFDGFTSFKVKFGKRGNPYGSKCSKGVLRSITRPMDYDRVANLAFNKLVDGIEIGAKPICLIVNGIERGSFLLEDGFDKFLIEKNRRREGSIVEVGFGGNFISNEPSPEQSNYNYKSTDTVFVSHFIREMNKGVVPLSLIDTTKLDFLIFLCQEFYSSHPLKAMNLHWYHNPVSNLMEPTIREIDLNEFDVIESDPFISAYLSLRDTAIHHKRQHYISALGDNFSHQMSLLEAEKMLENKKVIATPSYPKYHDTIYWSNIDVIIDSTLLIEENEVLLIDDGVTIHIKAGGKLMVLGQLLTNNTKDVVITGEINSSIYVHSRKQQNWANLYFDGLSSPNASIEPYHILPAAITFYKTEVELVNCHFSSNLKGDDFINFFDCSSVTVKQCYFQDILSDAIDSDFSNIKVKSCHFTNIGNDAIDCSGSNSKIMDCYFYGVQDKCLSAGENTTLDFENCEFKGSAIAVVSKDGSYVQGKSSLFVDNQLDFSAFKKKQEYSNASLFYRGKGNFSSLIEAKSRSNLDSNLVNNVKEVMYGKQYGRKTQK